MSSRQIKFKSVNRTSHLNGPFKMSAGIRRSLSISNVFETINLLPLILFGRRRAAVTIYLVLVMCSFDKTHLDDLLPVGSMARDDSAFLLYRADGGSRSILHDEHSMNSLQYILKIIHPYPINQ